MTATICNECGSEKLIVDEQMIRSYPMIAFSLKDRPRHRCIDCGEMHGQL